MRDGETEVDRFARLFSYEAVSQPETRTNQFSFIFLLSAQTMNQIHEKNVTAIYMCLRVACCCCWFKAIDVIPYRMHVKDLGCQHATTARHLRRTNARDLRQTI